MCTHLYILDTLLHLDFADILYAMQSAQDCLPTSGTTSLWNRGNRPLPIQVTNQIFTPVMTHNRRKKAFTKQCVLYLAGNSDWKSGWSKYSNNEKVHNQLPFHAVHLKKQSMIYSTQTCSTLIITCHYNSYIFFCLFSANPQHSLDEKPDIAKLTNNKVSQILPPSEIVILTKKRYKPIKWSNVFFFQL